MRLPIVYANTAVRVLEIAGANVASLIVIITSSVVIELDLIFLTALKTDRKARKRRLAPSPPPLPPPRFRESFFFSFLFFSPSFLEISSPSFSSFSHLCHSITKISSPFICVRRCYRFFQPASFGHLESKLIGWLLERMYLFWRNLKIWILNVQDFKNSKI